MRPRRLTTALGAMGALLALAVSVAAFAAASTTTLKLGSSESAVLHEHVAASPQGRTLYELSPETVHHLLCRSAACLQFWPPLTAPSRATRLKLAAGQHGRLALLRRSRGMLQVTLNGHPLYRYSGDHGRGQATGQGIKSFGGTWHAVAVGGVAPAAPAPSPPSYTYPATTTAAAPPPPPATGTATETTPAPTYPPRGY